MACAVPQRCESLVADSMSTTGILTAAGARPGRCSPWTGRSAPRSRPSARSSSGAGVRNAATYELPRPCLGDGQPPLPAIVIERYDPPVGEIFDSGRSWDLCPSSGYTPSWASTLKSFERTPVLASLRHRRFPVAGTDHDERRRARGVYEVNWRRLGGHRWIVGGRVLRRASC
jgi:hypothetical protein